MTLVRVGQRVGLGWARAEAFPSSIVEIGGG